MEKPAIPLSSFLAGPRKLVLVGEQPILNSISITNDRQTVTACGGRITDSDRYPSADYQGKRIYFCLRSCLQAFEADPERFLAGEIEHPIEED